MARIEAVLVTGAGRGIGRAIAKRLATRGWRIGCLARSQTAEEVAGEIRAAGGQADALEVDLGDPAAAEAEVSDWAAATGADGLGAVLAAGSLGRGGGVLSADWDEWDEVYRVNVLGNLAALRALLPRMIDRGFGRVVTFAGGGSAYGFPAFSAYSLSKTAMVRATENLQEELKGRGDIRLVCLAPGAVETEMLAQVRSAGAEVRTTVPIEEPVDCVEAWLSTTDWPFAGRFVHVRDAWRPLLGGEAPPALDPNHWWLRRTEPAR